MKLRGIRENTVRRERENLFFPFLNILSWLQFDRRERCVIWNPRPEVGQWAAMWTASTVFAVCPDADASIASFFEKNLYEKKIKIQAMIYDKSHLHRLCTAQPRRPWLQRKMQQQKEKVFLSNHQKSFIIWHTHTHNIYIFVFCRGIK